MSTEYDEYMTYVDGLRTLLYQASGLTFIHETTGGGCDCLEITDDAGRLIMITDCNGEVPSHDDAEWLIGIYADADSCGTEHTHMAEATDVRSCVAALKKFQSAGIITFDREIARRVPFSGQTAGR